MELYCPNIKKILRFSQKENFSYISGNEPCTFQPEKSLLCSSNENPKRTYIFSKESISYISGNRNSKKLLYICYILGCNLLSLKIKTLPYFV